MAGSDKTYKSQPPSNHPLKNVNGENKKIIRGNLGENIPNSLNKKEYYKNNNVLTTESSGNARHVHIPKNFNVVSPKIDSTNNFNVAQSTFHCTKNGCKGVSGSDNGNFDEANRSMGNIKSLLSKFESKACKLVNNHFDRSKFESKIGVNSCSNDYLNQIIKVGRANLNVVKEFKKDVPASRLPIMYKDDVEALLSRKPNSVRNFVNSLNKQLNTFSSYNGKFTGVNTSMYNIGNSRNNASFNGYNHKKFDSTSCKLENVDRKGPISEFNEYDEYANSEQYLTESPNLTININTSNRSVDIDGVNRLSKSDNLGSLDGNDGGRNVSGNDGSHNRVQEDEMLTYRSNTFGSFARRSPVSDYAKSTSDLCGSVTSDLMYQGTGSFYGEGSLSGNGNNYMAGNTSELYYANGGVTSNWGYRSDGLNQFNYRTDNAGGWNYGTEGGSSVGGSVAGGYGVIMMDGGYYDNFNSYFNSHFNSGYSSHYTEGSNEDEMFKNAKMTSRTNLTGVNTEEYGDNYYRYIDHNMISCNNRSREGARDDGSGRDKGGQNKKSIRFGDIIFSKRFLQSFSTLPEGVNLVIDTPQSQISSDTQCNSNVAVDSTGRLDSVSRVEGSSVLGNDPRSNVNGRSSGRASKRERIVVNSVNVIKSGWVWVQSSKTKNWVPKFVVLFYDAETTQYTSLPFFSSTINNNVTMANSGRGEGGSSSLGGWNSDSALGGVSSISGNSRMGDGTISRISDNVVNKERNYNRYFIGDVGTNDGFWRIYQLYTQINPKLQLNATIPIATTSAAKDDSNDINKLIEDNSSVYICILNHEPDNYYETIKNGNYLQLYTVDTSIAPYLRSFNSCWLSRFISRKINSNLELIIISLTDNYEFSFVPLCAAKLNATVNFTYEMEMANKNKINDEYDGWMFKLWEYSLRSNDYRLTNNGMNSNVDGNSTLGGWNSDSALGGSSSNGNECSLNDSFGIGNMEPNNNNTSPNPIDGPHCSAVSVDKSLLTRFYEYLCNFFAMDAPPMVVDDPKKEIPNLRTHIIKSINNNQKKRNEDESKDNKVDDLPSPRNFINWIDKYGFDDLSIKMNMYTLIKR